jgi:multidrug resistance protein
MKNSGSTSILFFTLFLDLLGYGLIIPLLPDYSRTLGATATMVGIITALYSFAQFVFGPILGTWSDRVGRRPVLLVTIGLSVVSYILFGAFTSLVVVILSRLLSGAASGNISVAQAYITDITPPEGRTKALGLIGTALGLGFIVGPPLGGAIKQYFGMEWVGYTAAALSLLNFALAFVRLPESLSESPSDNSSQKTLQRGIMFLDLQTFRKIQSSPQLSRLFAVYFLFMLGFTFLTITSVLMWKDKFGLAELHIGYTFALIGIISGVIQGIIGKLSARFSEKTLLTAGLIAMSCGIVAMPFVAAEQFLTLEIPLIVLFALGYALVLPTGASLVTQSIERRESGAVLGQYQSTAALARIIGPIAAASLYSIRMEYPFVAGGVILLLALPLSIAIMQPANAPQREEL